MVEVDLGGVFRGIYLCARGDGENSGGEVSIGCFFVCKRLENGREEGTMRGFHGILWGFSLVFLCGSFQKWEGRIGGKMVGIGENHECDVSGEGRREKVGAVIGWFRV